MAPFIAVQGKRGRVSFIPWQVAPGITKNQAEHSLFQTLSQVHDVHVAKTTEALEIALADEKVSGLLDCSLGTPCFYIETVTEDASGRTIEYSRSYFRGDKTSFVIERSYS
ncbi:GntR family transcriptional regulator [Exiguobacterium sp. s149]|uniref:GntR family transcriptional regulator n=1 Tax=Exiguobacterium sp. s149 TaxID=2751224 RepID=UPI0020374B22|nr:MULTISPECIES: GntR family transcriptional regulator [unclassified Exiguobacterium]